jgi:YggT family protein
VVVAVRVSRAGQPGALLPGRETLALPRPQRLNLSAPQQEAKRNVTVGGSIIQYWYFHLPNFVLAVLMYTLLGRVLLGLFVDPDSPNYIWRFFCRLTDPVVALVAKVTPKAAVPVIIWLFGVVWLFWLRVLLLSVLIALGIPPRAM